MLLLSSPWNDSPVFLARAQAALAPPAGMILHEKWQEKTFFPTETHGVGETDRSGIVEVESHLVMRNMTFEYLPRTDANLALADIRAQHPNAVGP